MGWRVASSTCSFVFEEKNLRERLDFTLHWSGPKPCVEEPGQLCIIWTGYSGKQKQKKVILMFEKAPSHTVLSIHP